MINKQVTIQDPEKEDFYYAVSPESIQIDDSEGQISATLLLNCDDETGEVAAELDLKLWFYQNGILRAKIEEPASERFRVS